MKEDTTKCVKCNEYRAAIRRHKMSCGLVNGDELIEEYGRHRFTPYSKKELALIAEEAKAEEEYWEAMGRKLQTLESY